jgi:hypothetical protein
MPERNRLQSWERVAALLAAAVALTLNVAAAFALFVPQSTFGYNLIYTNGFEVASVDVGSAAERAGIAAGDHLDFRASKLHERIVGLSYQPALPGESVTLAVIRDGRMRTVTLQTQPLTQAESGLALFSPLASFLRLAGFAYIVVALLVLLRRPNRMTWGLFLYLVSATNITVYRFPDWLFPIAQLASDALDVAGPIGLLVFAARFPNDTAPGWRAWLDRLAIPMGLLLAIPDFAWDAKALFVGQGPAPWMSLGATLGALALILAAGITLAVTYVRSARWERQRLQWALVGLLFTLFSYVSQWARYWPPAYALATSDALVWISTILYACAPFAIAYAVVRQRVFDISFVISRTLVYTILTGAIFAVFAFIEWLVSHVIERTGVAIVLAALAAIAIAVSLGTVHTRVEDFIDRTLFRRRHQAERHLADVAAGLPNAQNNAAVEQALLREPVAAYSLGNATLFLRDDDGEFVRQGEVLDRAVPLRLQGRRRPLRLHDFAGNGREEVEPGDPVLAVPVFVRSRLEAVAVYGAHVNGEDIDPDEAASLQAIGAAAGIAYEHLDSARVEREAARWRKLAEHQARELASLRERVERAGPR